MLCRRTDTPPIWHRDPEEQISELLRLMYRWNTPKFPIPKPPDHLPKSTGEVLLLTMHLPSSEGGPRSRRDAKTTCMKWWDEACGITPTGWSLETSRVLPSSHNQWHSAHRQRLHTGVQWVGFDPIGCVGIAPRNARQVAESNGLRLAGAEVLMAMRLLPELVARWTTGECPLPTIAGIEYRDSKHLKGSSVPEIGINLQEHQLWLQPTDRIQTAAAIPTIRLLDGA